jgi:sporulation protein YlmC with PRC-barrel domain
MLIKKEIIGKEVIDTSGIVIGKVEGWQLIKMYFIL